MMASGFFIPNCVVQLRIIAIKADLVVLGMSLSHLELLIREDGE